MYGIFFIKPIVYVFIKHKLNQAPVGESADQVLV